MKYLLGHVIRNRKNIFRLAATFLDNLWVWRFYSMPRRGPLAVVWDVNNRCNLRCMFCDYWRIENDKSYLVKKEELSKDKKLRLIHQLGDCGVGLLSFCGGEPLLSEELCELILQAKKKGMLVNISTNGFLLETKARMLVDAGTDSVTISMDSCKSFLHDKLRNTEKAFDKALRGVERLRSLQKRGRPFIQLRCLINRLNRFELKEFTDFWKNRVDGIIFKPIYKNDSVMFGVPEELNFKNSDKEMFKKYFDGVLDSCRMVDNLYHRGIPGFILKQDKEKYNYPCLAGTFFSEIDCEGSLYFCQEIAKKEKYKLGNLTRECFMGLWSSDKASELRKSFKEKQVCSCWMERTLFNMWMYRYINPFWWVKDLFKKGN